MNPKSWKKWLVALVLMVLLAGTVGAQDLGYQLAIAMQPIPSELYMRAGLNEEEIARIEALQEEARKERVRVALELNIARAELAKLLYYPNPDPDAVEALMNQNAELQSAQEKAQVRAYLGIRNICGEKRWVRLMRATRQAQQQRERIEQAQNQNRVQNAPENPSSRGSGTGSGGTGSGGAAPGGNSTGRGG